jgi:hypothetical protein
MHALVVAVMQHTTRILVHAHAVCAHALTLPSRVPLLPQCPAFFAVSFWYRVACRCLVCEHPLRQRVAKRRSFIGYPALGHGCAYAYTHGRLTPQHLMACAHTTCSCTHTTRWLTQLVNTRIPVHVDASSAAHAKVCTATLSCLRQSAVLRRHCAGTDSRCGSSIHRQR